tara:strand:+ start:909 stop:1310 length:402 start_codon:yes stop_codon:yes gene_type:complete
MKNSFDFEEDFPQINILPMIDIIFVILSFFIISSLYLVRLETIPVDLPNAETANQEKDSVIVITLDLEDRIFIDDKLLDISLVNNEILSKIKNTNNRKIIIRADKNVKYGKVISILDILRKLEGIKIGVWTES